MTELKSPDGELSRDLIRSRCRCERNDWIFGDQSALFCDDWLEVKIVNFKSS